MIQSTSLLSLPPSLPQGSARQPGGGAFVLPDGDEAVGGEDALLPEGNDGDRQDDAAGGNGLPVDVPSLDPWLVATLLSPALPAPDPKSTAPLAAVKGGAPAVTIMSETPVASAATGSSSVLLCAIDRTAAPLPGETLNHLLADRPVAATPQIAEKTSFVGRTTTTATPSLSQESVRASIAVADAPPSRRPDDPAPTPPSVGADASVEAPSSQTFDRSPVSGANGPPEVTDSGEPAPVFPPIAARRANGGPARTNDRRVSPVSDANTLPFASTIARATVAPRTMPAEPSATLPGGAPAPAILRETTLAGAALRSSALTPLLRDEIASVAALVAPGSSSRAVDPVPSGSLPPPAATAMAKTDSDVPPLAGPVATLPLGWQLSMPAFVTPRDGPRSAGFVALPGTALPGVSADGAAVLSEQAATGATAIAFRSPPRASLPAAASAVLGDPVTARIDAPDASLTRASAPSAAMTPTQTTLIPPPVVAPSGVVFGAARYAAQASKRREEPSSILGGVTASAAPASQPAVTAAPAAQAPLDVRHERWPTAMIERIEMIRDAANEVDTRIRLVPDALGAIDVDVRRDGDTLHIRFAAEQPQTRALLQDAAPRLADAAESRGLRLSQSTVGADGGAPAHQQHQQQDRRPPLAPAPARASRPAAEAKADVDDTRLA